MKQDNAAIKEILAADQDAIARDWVAELTGSAATGRTGGTVASLSDARDLLQAFQDGIRAGADAAQFDTAQEWAAARSLLGTLSASRAAQGSSAGETSQFVLSLKRPIFQRVQARVGASPDQLMSAIWLVSTVVDRMAQYTVSIFQKTREEVIGRQQQELLELSTPVIKLWDGVLAVPMIGTLDSSRTQLVMEALLQRIVDTGSELAIIDITGVPTVDTLVAQHLLKTVTAIRLMGADCIISGVRPQIAQTIVHLGIDLAGITTKASLADALALALKRAGYTVSRTKS
jgi:rsbT co-antagonist protein RsbR